MIACSIGFAHILNPLYICATFGVNTMMKPWTLVLTCFLALLLISCDDDGGGDTSSVLTLEFSSLSPTTAGSVYGVWLKENGAFASLGEFTVNDAGTISNSLYPVNRDRLTQAQGLLISYEVEGFTTNTPSSIRILAGDFVNKGVRLTIDHPDAMGIAFTDIKAAYILATPTDGNSISNFAGLWYFDPSDSTSTLELPTLGANWTYESWIQLEDESISMGTFSDVAMADDSDEFGGMSPGYPSPGQDFLQGRSDFPLDLTNQEVFLTVEPVADTDSMPFVIRIYQADIVDTIPNVPVPIEFDDRIIPRGLGER